MLFELHFTVELGCVCVVCGVMVYVAMSFFGGMVAVCVRCCLGVIVFGRVRVSLNFGVGFSNKSMCSSLYGARI